MKEIAEEFMGAELGDGRLNKRLVELAKCFEKKHGQSITFSCNDWKTAKSARRCLTQKPKFSLRFSERYWGWLDSSLIQGMFK